MNKDRNAFLAGLFILVSVGMMVFVIVGIAGLNNFLEPTQALSVQFQLLDNIGGLATGDDVRIGGAKVGVVRGISFEMPIGGTPRIKIDFTMPKKFVVHTDADVTIESQLTGSSV